jgi:hypothetical protein
VTDDGQYGEVVSVWLVVGDPELRALLLTIGEDAGLRFSALDPLDAGTRLAAGERPEAVLVGAHDRTTEVASERLRGISRLALASTGPRWTNSVDGIEPGMQLKLPASLDEVENVLKWLAWDGPQVARASSADSNSRLA